MTALLDLARWYLDHLALVLLWAALFDVVCWAAIAVFVVRKRRSHR